MLRLLPPVPSAPGAVSLGTTSAVSLEAVLTERSDSRSSMRVEYPVFSSDNAFPVDPLNSVISNFVAEKISDFFSVFPSGKTGEGLEHIPYEFYISWKPVQMNGRYISIVFYIYTYTGGANGMQNVFSVNYDCASGSLLSLYDVLKPSGEDWLKTLAAQVRQVLDDQFESESHDYSAFVSEGTAPDESNFSVFTFDDYSITFYFQKYQVAPGVAGIVTAVIPR